MAVLRFLALGVGVGLALQGWRQLPPDGPPTSHAAIVVVLVGMLAAYFAGRWWGNRGPVSASAWAQAKASAHASATAHQQQSQTVNVAVLVPGQGAGGPGRHSAGLEALPWIGEQRQEVGGDLLEGIDPLELRELLGEPEPGD